MLRVGRGPLGTLKPRSGQNCSGQARFPPTTSPRFWYTEFGCRCSGLALGSEFRGKRSVSCLPKHVSCEARCLSGCARLHRLDPDNLAGDEASSAVRRRVHHSSRRQLPQGLHVLRPSTKKRVLQLVTKFQNLFRFWSGFARKRSLAGTLPCDPLRLNIETFYYTKTLPNPFLRTPLAERARGVGEGPQNATVGGLVAAHGRHEAAVWINEVRTGPYARARGTGAGV